MLTGNLQVEGIINLLQEDNGGKRGTDRVKREEDGKNFLKKDSDLESVEGQLRLRIGIGGKRGTDRVKREEDGEKLLKNYVELDYCFGVLESKIPNTYSVMLQGLGLGIGQGSTQTQNWNW